MKIDRTLRTGRELVLARTLHASRARVFEAWTCAELLPRWWAPRGAALRVDRLAPRPGGRLAYALRAPGGRAAWARVVYREVAAPERLVFVSAFTDARGQVVRHPDRPEWPLEILHAVLLEGAGPRTHLTLRVAPLAAMQSEREVFEAAKSATRRELEAALDRLEALLAQAPWRREENRPRQARGSPTGRPVATPTARNASRRFDPCSAAGR